MPLTITIHQESFPLAQVFRISRGAKTAADVIRVTVSDGQHEGHGESVPYGRYGESLASVTSQLEAIKHALVSVDDHKKLHELMPAGAARNALDCALWDLKANQRGTSVSELLGLPLPVAIPRKRSVSTPLKICRRQRSS